MIGKRVGRYQIEAEIGRGGMGVVYRATQVTLNRTVAVKMLPDHLAASEEYLSRFRREAETLARLQHPNIVHIYDVEQAEGAHFIIMEYVDGLSLTQLLARDGRFDPARARDVAEALADALSAAHRRGIVHRDIKPDNILFSDGRPKLTDFGIAHMLDSKVRTRTGLLLGTPYYLSPEQASGVPITAASDVYSLGVVLYQMLSGRVPFDADTPLAVALMHVKDPPPPLNRVAPHLPAGLVSVVDRAMAKEPQARFRSGRELQRALAALDLTPPSLADEGDRDSARCSSCGTGLAPDFLTCPTCGRAARARHEALRHGAGVWAGRAAGVAKRWRASGARLARRAGDGAARSLAVLRRSLGEWGARPGSPRGRSALAWASTMLRRRVGDLPLPLVAGVGLLTLGLVLALLQSLLAGQGVIAFDGPSTGGFEVPAGPPPDVGPGSRAAVASAESRDSRSRPAPRSDPSPDAGPPSTGGGGDDAEPDDRAAPVDAPPAGPDGAADSETSTRAGPVDPGGGDAAKIEDAFDELEARRAILAIVERQRHATETGNLELFLRDLAPGLHADERGDFMKAHEVAEAVRSRVSAVLIEFTDPRSATVELDVTLEVRRPGSEGWTIAFDGRITWEVARSDGAWVITDVG